MYILTTISGSQEDVIVSLVERDILERGRSIDSVISQYNRFVKPAHDLFIQPVLQSLVYEICGYYNSKWGRKWNVN
jgi:uridine kinase